MLDYLGKIKLEEYCYIDYKRFKKQKFYVKTLYNICYVLYTILKKIGKINKSLM